MKVRGINSCSHTHTYLVQCCVFGGHSMDVDISERKCDRED
jgi:hypothetical protein